MPKTMLPTHVLPANTHVWQDCKTQVDVDIDHWEFNLVIMMNSSRKI